MRQKLISKRTDRGIFATARTLGEVSTRWLNPRDLLRQQAVSALQVSTGFTSAMIEKAIEACFAEITEEKILAFLKPEPPVVGVTAASSSRVLHFLAGNVFTSWVHGAVLTLLRGAECWLKPSTQEPVFPSLWKQSVEGVNSKLAQSIHVVAWEESLFSQVQAVVIYGSDETLDILRPQLPSGVRWIGYGHKFSVAVVFKEALLPQNLSALYQDAREAIEPFRLQGCLSPQIIFIEGKTQDFLKPLVGAKQPLPMLRFFHDFAVIEKELGSHTQHLSTLGYAGDKEQIAPYLQRMGNLGFSRCCPLSEMQRPSLSWHNGGVSLWKELSALSSGAG